MGMFSDTFDRNQATKTDDTVAVKVAPPSSTRTDIKLSESTVRLMEDLIRLASPEERRRFVAVSKALDKAEKGNVFRRVWVDKNDPEGDEFIFTRMNKSEKDYITPEELEAEASEEWGIGGYIAVYRLVESEEPLVLGRLATDDEVKELLAEEAANKKKAREATNNAN